MQPALQDNQLMSKHRVLSFKPQLRLEWRGQDGQNETEQPDHSASLGDSITSSTRIRFSVHTAVNIGDWRCRLLGHESVSGTFRTSHEVGDESAKWGKADIGALLAIRDCGAPALRHEPAPSSARWRARWVK